MQEEENRNHTDSLSDKFFVFSKIDILEEFFSKFPILSSSFRVRSISSSPSNNLVFRCKSISKVIDSLSRVIV